MSTISEIEEAASKLPLPDFVQLLEDLWDMASERAALSEAGEAAIPWQSLKRDLDAIHR